MIKSVKTSVVLLCVCFLFLGLVGRVEAVTRYVNSGSDGSANNPTRAFDDLSYVVNDSYQTLEAAYTGASSGDIIEFSGGNSGQSYLAHTGPIYKVLTFQGSSISGHSGTVSITRNPAYTAAIMRLKANGITLKNLEISGDGSFRIDNDDITVENVVFKTNGAGASSYSIVFYSQPGYVTTFNNVIIKGDGYGNGVFMNTDAGTANFNNCVINANNFRAVYASSGTTVNLNNCAITSNGTGYYTTFDTNGGTINTTNSFFQGPLTSPHDGLQAHVGTWNSVDDITNDFPWYNRTAANLGFVSFAVDDTDNNEYFATLANYAMDTYGIALSLYANETNAISAGDKVNLQTLYKAGHDIGFHTKSHTDLSYTDAIKVTYSGANADMALVVSSSGTSLSITGSGDTYGPIDLTNAAYDTIGELCIDIGAQTNFACAMVNSQVRTGVLSAGLDDASTALAIGVATNIPFDDDTGPNNRYYKNEITDAITDLENAIHEDPASSAYQTKTMAFPYNAANERVMTWIEANTSLIGTRSSYNDASALALYNKSSLKEINLYNVTSDATYSGQKGTDYDSLTDAGKKIRMERAARVMATYASNGTFIAMLTHYAYQISLQDFTWFLDELVKYRSAYNITVDSFSNNINEIRTSGDWTASSTVPLYYERTFAGSDDFTPRFNSPFIDAGTAISGRTVDVLGNSIYGALDIGAYEYQPPYIMGIDEIPTDAAVRVYGDEKFRNKTATSSATTADLSISIPNGDTTEWLDVAISTWNNTGDRNKIWTASSTVDGLANTINVVGDLNINSYYNVTVNDVLGQNITGDSCTNGLCLSDAALGQITFTYTGINTTDNVFNIIETVPTCSVVDNASTYNSYPTCGVATCNSGYVLTNGTCVAMGGGGMPLPLQSIGAGSKAISVDMGQVRSVGIIPHQGINVLSYVDSQVNFSIPVSSIGSNQSHSFKVYDLDLLNNIVTIIFQSDPIKINLALGQTKLVDLDRDGINDIEATFSDLVINRVEITIKPLLDLNQIENSPIDYSEGDLLKESNKPAVYLIDNNQKRPFISEKAFLTNGFKWEDIKEVIDLSAVSVGGIIYAVSVESPVQVKELVNHTFRYNLSIGTVASDVKKLQQYLNNNGFRLTDSGLGSPGNETEFFGRLTQSALIKFQQAKNIIPAVGFLGPITRELINK